MKTAPRLIAAALVASLVPPAIISGYGAVGTRGVPSGIFFIAMAAWVVGLAHILMLGLPAFILLLRYKRVSLLSLSLTGFVAGALSSGVISFPRRLEGYSSGQDWHGKYVELYVNGEPTQFAWLAYAESCVYMGFYGLLTAAVAWATWQAMAAGNGKGVDA